MRKAFTLVELAIVLVIVGILMGMAIKGRELIYTTRVVQEINKLRKFEAALSTHYSKHGAFPVSFWSNIQQEILRNSLVETGMVKESDFDASFLSNGNKWSFFNVVYRADSATGDGYPTLGSTGIVRYRHDQQQQDMVASYLLDSNLQGNDMTNKIVCHTEKRFGDNSIFTGAGRVSIWGSQNNLTDPIKTASNYDDCEFGNIRTVYHYMIRVF